MPIPEGGDPLNAYMKSGEACVEGKLYKVDTAKMTEITAKGDEVIGVGAEATVDAAGDSVTGGACKIYNDGIRPVLTKAGTFQPFGLVFASDDVDGYATPTDPTTGTIIGRAIVPIATTYVQGDMVPAMLCLCGKNVTS